MKNKKFVEDHNKLHDQGKITFKLNLNQHSDLVLYKSYYKF